MRGEEVLSRHALGAGLRIFYTTDVHGSEKCFRKFVSAAKFYKSNVVILGGDITGKMIVPVVEGQAGTFTTTYDGVNMAASTSAELTTLESAIRNAGLYPYRTNSAELEELRASPEKVDALFTNLMIQSIESWMAVLDGNLKGMGVKCFITPGNDDRPAIDTALAKSTMAVNPEGSVVDIDGYEMLSSGYSNPTPWKTPRECSEEELANKIKSMTAQVRSMERCIFNLHCPPYASGLDSAPKLDENLKQVVQGGEIIMAPAGSVSVRKSIETHKPLLGLHGHIHESRGSVKIGRTLCLNPGSEYNTGILRGVVVNLNDGQVKSYQLTSG
jgi:Icc-related predicted phosphoesterase